MDQALKQRLVGAVVLVALAVLFLPSLFNGGRPNELETLREMPPMPVIEPIVVQEPHQANKTPHESRSVSDMFAFDEDKVVELEELESAASDKTKISAKLAADGTPEAWAIQVGSFADKAKAQKLVDELQASGERAFLRSVQRQGKTINRVMIGPEMNKREAERIKALVDKRYGVKSMVFKFEP